MRRRFAIVAFAAGCTSSEAPLDRARVTRTAVRDNALGFGFGELQNSYEVLLATLGPAQDFE